MLKPCAIYARPVARFSDPWEGLRGVYRKISQYYVTVESPAGNSIYDGRRRVWHLSSLHPRTGDGYCRGRRSVIVSPLSQPHFPKLRYGHAGSAARLRRGRHGELTMPGQALSSATAPPLLPCT
ncbi:hypothetical protein WMY93_023379 [Mugilogobius chulae]|uniref:Uncharacterized protein n=1 Tax=Mugilogobius chulae TaxID=88201 RepID=A0AAW0N578_9GOBI